MKIVYDNKDMLHATFSLITETVSSIVCVVVSITFFSYIPKLVNCSHMVSTNSIFASLSNLELFGPGGNRQLGAS